VGSGPAIATVRVVSAPDEVEGEPFHVDVSIEPAGRLDVSMLAMPVCEPAELTGATAALDASLGGRISALIADGELKGKRGDLVVVHALGDSGPRRVALVGLGSAETLDPDAVRTAAAAVARRARGIGNGVVGWGLGSGLPLAPAQEATAVVEGAALARYEAGAWKSADDRREPPHRLILCGEDARAIETAARRAALVCEWTNRGRHLVDAPANELTPERLAEHAAEMAGDVEHVRASTLGRREIEEAGMGALAAVAKGSHAEPRLIALEYEPPQARSDVTLGFVGKAITFDSGGLSLKPAARMDAMKSDMGGGAAVLCAVGAAAALEIPVRIVGLVPASENLPSGHSTRPGDIVTALNGKTIEITNTDAEGRLVLADALVDVRRRGATHVVDLATLTGGVVIALGDFHAGLMGNDDAWLAEIEAAGEQSGDHVWRLPIHETLKRYIRSDVADMQNSSGLRQAQPIYAAWFLQEFAGEGPWAHLDIAGTAYLERGRGDYYTRKGATGFGVRLLTALAERMASRERPS
jgi:leucyl aminopeptidase